MDVKICDRCDERIKSSVPNRVKLNNRMEIDLCDRCSRELREWLKPPPKQAKKE